VQHASQHPGVGGAGDQHHHFLLWDVVAVDRAWRHLVEDARHPEQIAQQVVLASGKPQMLRQRVGVLDERLALAQLAEEFRLDLLGDGVLTQLDADDATDLAQIGQLVGVLLVQAPSGKHKVSS
jgi:hypothetical protein